MNSFDELMKHLTFAMFFKKLTEKPTPALIEYKINDKGTVSAHTEGREVELDFLTAIILRDRIEKVAKDLGDKYVDSFFDLMKEIIPLIDKFEEKIIDPDKSDIDSIKKFNDLFKGLGL
jgi:Mg2+ and Co2+ transporter CorA